MTKLKPTRSMTPYEKQNALSLISDYILFGVPQHQMPELIYKRTGRMLNARTITSLVAEVKKSQVTADQWLDGFARDKLADYFRIRISEVEYIQQRMLLAFEEEDNKPDKNKKLMNEMAKTITDTSKLLAEFAFSPPIVAKIKELLPIDINELNDRSKDHKEKVKALFGNYIDTDKSNESESESEQSSSETLAEFEKIQQLRESARNSFVIPKADEPDNTESSDDDSTDSSSNTDDEGNRVF